MSKIQEDDLQEVEEIEENNEVAAEEEDEEAVKQDDEDEVDEQNLNIENQDDVNLEAEVDQENTDVNDQLQEDAEEKNVSRVDTAQKELSRQTTRQESSDAEDGDGNGDGDSESEDNGDYMSEKEEYIDELKANEEEEEDEDEEDEDEVPDEIEYTNRRDSINEIDEADRRTSFEVRQEQLQKDKDEFDVVMDNYEVLAIRWRRLRTEWQIMEDNSALRDNADTHLINGRVREVKGMCRNQVSSQYLMSLLTPELRELVDRFNSESNAEFLARRRRNWTELNYFAYAGRMARLFSKMGQKKNYMPTARKAEMNTQKSDNYPSEVDIVKTASGKTQDYKCTISKDLRDCLLKPPKHRTKREIDRIVWYLRASKAFTHLFPDEMEIECAKNVGYEKYDSGRILAYQGVPADKFYYVISGKIDCIRQFKLVRTKDEVYKKMSRISKRTTSDPENMEAQIPREHFMVSSGLVEVLVISKPTFDKLTNRMGGPPLDFLKTISIFGEFPCHLFRDNPEAIDIKYYCNNKTVVNDSNRTPWLHIVKSGSVKVIRRQRIYETTNDKGLLKSNSSGNKRAKDMMGIGARQRTMREFLEKRSQTLPYLQESPSLVHNPFSKSLKLIRARTSFNGNETPSPENARSKTIHKMEQAETVPTVTVTNDKNGGEDAERVRTASDSSNLLTPGPVSLGEVNTLASVVRMAAAVTATGAAAKILNVKLQPYQGSSDELRRTYVTGDRKMMSSTLTGKTKKWRTERMTLVQLDVLRAGNVFGFDHIEAPLASEGVGLALVSEGAEIIRISKRFFLQQAENNTMLKIQTLIKNYMTEEQARKDILEKDIWSRYKDDLLHGIAKTHKTTVF